MKILAIETSGKTFSLAINECGRNVASFYYDCGNAHSEMIIPAMERLLKDTRNTCQDIDKFAVSIGPGSFTGIRVGITMAKTFAQALNKPIVAVDTLSILEKSSIKIKGTKIISAVDALRNEVYVKEGKKIVIKNIDSFIETLKKHKNNLLLIGNATISYKKKLTKELGVYSISLPYNMHMPQAHVLATIAYQSEKSTTSYSKVIPLYIRRSWAEENNSSFNK
ncbi:MAG: tRNA (adenosine(37)-N6)-threonylcarbamoyltransferase complex dimerization subunit type 1 TsaB [Endomicrobium sp.]|jgi:tRNA threonylcarbamoyladenosine biosynthesis protein TsaB|nr:tRNA (adenosine(37)-N6)-threonylcarbamoyltransferase complex dimerization subunit type 1 TsaB [Endomicrobium sp.]